MLVQGRRQNWTFSYSRVLGRQKTLNRKTKMYDKNNFIWKYTSKIIISENIHQKIIYPKYMPKIIYLKIYGKKKKILKYTAKIIYIKYTAKIISLKIYGKNNLSQNIRQKRFMVNYMP